MEGGFCFPSLSFSDILNLIAGNEIRCITVIYVEEWWWWWWWCFFLSLSSIQVAISNLVGSLMCCIFHNAYPTFPYFKHYSITLTEKKGRLCDNLTQETPLEEVHNRAPKCVHILHISSREPPSLIQLNCGFYQLTDIWVLCTPREKGLRKQSDKVQWTKISFIPSIKNLGPCGPISA